MSVSKSAILFRFPKPVKKAFPLLERREASMEKTPSSGKSTRLAYAEDGVLELAVCERA